MRRLIKVAALTAMLGGAASPALGADKGEVQFQTYCSACHKVTGLGVPHAFPALAGDRFLKGDGGALLPQAERT